MTDSADQQTHIVLVNAIVFKDNKVLVSQRSHEETHAPGKWTIPGGKVDRTAGNVPNILQATAAKETLEETGIHIKKEMRFLSNNSFIRSSGHHVIAINFLCEYESGIAQPLEDTITCQWTTREELEQFDFAPNVKEYIVEAFEKLTSYLSKH